VTDRVLDEQQSPGPVRRALVGSRVKPVRDVTQFAVVLIGPVDCYWSVFLARVFITFLKLRILIAFEFGPEL
jgi:hypothetical protein